MIPRFSALIAALLSAVAWAQEYVPETSVLLWPDGAPEAIGSKETDRPQLTVHLAPKEIATGCAVVVNPGGGYRGLAADHEGIQVAQWLNRIGVSAFVLRYRLLPDYQPSTALLDAQRAIRYVRHQAEEFGVSEDRIGMLGFSAGGHLTTAAGTNFDAGDPEAVDPIDRNSSRPDFLVPVYAAVSPELLKFDMGDWMSTEKLVTKETPPAFLLHTHVDTVVTPNHSIVFYQALLAAGVPAEMHIFTNGAHGTGLAPGDPDLVEWQSLLHHWLRRSKFLTDAERQMVKGKVTVDGDPLFWGWVTFHPEDERFPYSVASIGPNNAGAYQLSTADGPCAGTYRVVVHRVSKDFSRKQSGAYSMEDAEKFDWPAEVTIAEGENTVDFAVTSN